MWQKKNFLSRYSVYVQMWINADDLQKIEQLV